MSYGHGPNLLADLGPCHICPNPANGLIVNGHRYCPPHGRQAYTAQEHPTMTLIPVAAVRHVADLFEGSVGTTAATAVDTLADKVTLVEEYQPGPDWTIRTVEELGAAWVIRWDRLTIALRDRSDLELARLIAAERVTARKALRVAVLTTARDLGLPDSRYYYPATRAVGETCTQGPRRCPGCGNTVTGSHRPGSGDCRDARVERIYSRAQ